LRVLPDTGSNEQNSTKLCYMLDSETDTVTVRQELSLLLTWPRSLARFEFSLLCAGYLVCCALFPVSLRV